MAELITCLWNPSEATDWIDARNIYREKQSYLRQQCKLNSKQYLYGEVAELIKHPTSSAKRNEDGYVDI